MSYLFGQMSFVPKPVTISDSQEITHYDSARKENLFHAIASRPSVVKHLRIHPVVTSVSSKIAPVNLTQLCNSSFFSCVLSDHRAEATLEVLSVE